VREAVQKGLSRPVLWVDDPELAVCQGAALYGAQAQEVSPAVTVRPGPGTPRAVEQQAGPRTRVVDALGRGDHFTLTEALHAAGAGDQILVRPGLYMEGVVIDKPVEVIGEGELGQAVIEAAGRSTVVFKASAGRIANLTLRQVGDGKWLCVEIAQGRLELEDCDIMSEGDDCVGIHGPADPYLRRNRIHGKKGGVYVHDNGGEPWRTTTFLAILTRAWGSRRVPTPLCAATASTTEREIKILVDIKNRRPIQFAIPGACLTAFPPCFSTGP
jgi:hypothetical protein